MSGAVLVAIAAAIGNLLQGWDNATIAGNCLIFYDSKSIILCMNGYDQNQSEKF